MIMEKETILFQVSVPEEELEELRQQPNKRIAVPGRKRQRMVEMGLYMRQNLYLFPSYSKVFFSKKGGWLRLPWRGPLLFKSLSESLITFTRRRNPLVTYF